MYEKRLVMIPGPLLHCEALKKKGGGYNENL